jgi:chemotaxis protein CheX
MTDHLFTPFLEATRNVFQLMLDLSDVSDSPVETFECDDEVDVSIGVTGDLVGEVIYRFSRETSLNMVKIMSGMEIESIDDFVTSAISEIANIISGNVLTMLAKDNVKCDLLPPVLQKPDNSKEYSIHSACCISTSVGNVCLDIRLNHAK